jgi:ribulose-phosphate 3-epimerase
VRHLQEELNPLSELEVDGGIYASNIDDVVRSGANVIVAGTAVFNKKGTAKENIAALRKSARKASWREV